jgi:hypothetical protein
MISTLFKGGSSILSTVLGKPGKAIWNTVKTAQKDMAGSELMKSTTASMDLLKSGWNATGGGKAINKIASAGSSLGKFASRNPVSRALTSSKMMVPAIGVGFTFGAAHGAASAVSQRMSDRQMTTARGMDPNNLGTDGLTLALSKRRHR